MATPVRFLNITSEQLSNAPVTDGTVIFLSDRPGLLYDLGESRKDFTQVINTYNLYTDVLASETGYSEIVVAISHPAWVDTTDKALNIEMVLSKGVIASYIIPFEVPDGSTTNYPVEMKQDINMSNTWYVSLPKTEKYYEDTTNPVYETTEKLMFVKVSLGTFEGTDFTSEQVLGSVAWPHSVPEFYVNADGNLIERYED